MSNHDPNQDAEFSEDDNPVLVEQNEEQPTPVEKRPRARSGVAWLALLLAIVAAAGIGFVLFNDWRAGSTADEKSSEITDLRQELRQARAALSALEAELTALGEADNDTAAQISQLRSGLAEELQIIGTLPARTSNLEASLSAMQGISAGARNRWLLAEAEYYLQIGNAQLQLAGNPDLARMALGMADERLQQMANPALTDVRRAVADGLAALDAMDKPDIEGISLTLSSLARVVDSLPLRQIGDAADDQEVTSDPQQSGFGRAWGSVKDAFGGLVRVSRPDEAATPLLTPDAVYFLRTNLALQLQAARLALLRGEADIYQQSLDDAAAWLGTYFDANSAPVGSALETLAEIRNGVFDVTTPDISESLTLLRQFKTLNDTTP